MGASLYLYANIDSLILSEEEKEKLHQMLADKWHVNFIDFDLIYRGSRDGYQSHNFYKKCGIENTLCIIETDQTPKSNVFGGFTTKPWKLIDKPRMRDRLRGD